MLVQRTTIELALFAPRTYTSDSIVKHAETALGLRLSVAGLGFANGTAIMARVCSQMGTCWEVRINEIVVGRALYRIDT